MEEKLEKGKDHSIIAAALIFLFIAAAFILIISERIHLGKFTLPFYLVVAGMFFFAAAMEIENGIGEWVASLGFILNMLGSVLFYQYGTSDWESWIYTWPLVVPTGIGLGQLAYGAVKAKKEPFERGKVLIQIGLGLFILTFVLSKILYR